MQGDINSRKCFKRQKIFSYSLVDKYEAILYLTYIATFLSNFDWISIVLFWLTIQFSRGINMSRNYGYVRVSTREQNEQRQIIALQSLGIEDLQLFIDKQSGRDFERINYMKMLKTIEPEDIIYIKSIDRLGRNYTEILDQWRILTKIKKVEIVVLDMPLLDTRKDKNLMGTFISDIVLQILSFVAENERINIRQRQAEGIIAAKVRGVKFGRPSLPLDDSFFEAHEKWQSKELSCVAAARLCNMSPSSFRYRSNQQKEKKQTFDKKV